MIKAACRKCTAFFLILSMLLAVVVQPGIPAYAGEPSFAEDFAREIVAEAERLFDSDDEILYYYMENAAGLTDFELFEEPADAFRYLCDLTVFPSGSVRVFTVRGELSVGGEEGVPHAWNVAQMDDGRYYPADTTVTTRVDGEESEVFLFLKGYTEIYEDAEGPYGYSYETVREEGGILYDVPVRYEFDEETMLALTAGERTLSDTDYGILRDEASTDETSTDEASADESSADEASADGASTGEASTDEASTDETSTDEASTDEASADETSTDEASADEASADEASADGASTDEEASPAEMPQDGEMTEEELQEELLLQEVELAGLQPAGANPAGVNARATDVLYTGKAGQFKSGIVITDAEGRVLKSGRDYDAALMYYYTEDTELENLTRRYRGQAVQEKDVVPVGTVLRVAAFLKGGYSGTVSAYYRMVAGDISRAEVRIDPQYYTGEEIRPDKDAVTVILSGKVLTARDYEIVSYENNIQKGTAKLTIRGMGAYGREKTVSFSIVERPANYSVSFFGNRATSGKSSRMDLVAGKTYRLKANVFQRTGFVFSGWNTQPDGSGTAYADRESITAAAENGWVALELYAQWTAVEYSIAYHLNGGPNHPANTTVSYTTEDADIEILAPERADWPRGYQFAGWYTDVTFKNKITAIREHSTGNINLYARWVPYTYTVVFDGNGATKGTMESQMLTFGAQQKLNKNAFTRTGHVFLGWSFDPAARDAEYVNGQEVTDLTEPTGSDREILTLYAVWRNDFSIAYETNESASSPVQLDSTMPFYIDNYDYGKSYALPVPVRPGYAFDGWYTDNGTFKKRVKKIEKTTKGDLVLYAKWTPNTYTIVFDGNGKTGGSMSNLSVRFEKDTTLRNNTYSRKGHAFRGWAPDKNAAADEAVYTNGAAVDWEWLRPLKNKTSVRLYAVWEEVPYQVTYETNGGVLTGEYVSEYWYNREVHALPVPVREGYVFGGWYREPGFKNRVREIVKTEARDLTLYAKWTASYTVHFYGDKPADAPAESVVTGMTNKNNTQNMRYESAAALAGNGFKLPGYVFMGWALTKEEADAGIVTYTNRQKINRPQLRTDTAVDPLSGEERTTLHLDLYAVWRGVFTVTFDTTGGTMDGADASGLRTVPYEYGTGITAAELSTYVPVRDGYTFAGWYREPSLRTREKGIAGTRYGDIRLYAKWTGKRYTVTFDSNLPHETDGEGNILILRSVSGRMTNQTLVYGKAVALKKNAFAVKGFTFTGWALSAQDAADGIIAFRNLEKTDGTQFPYSGFLEQGLELHAVWEKNQYAVTYANLAPGAVKGNNPDTYTVDDSFVLQDAEVIGKVFLGWYADKRFTKRVTGIGKGTTGNKTFYAKWRTDNLAIRYILNGGQFKEETPGYTLTYGRDGQDFYVLPEAFREGYRFDGWFKDKNLKTKVTGISASTGLSITLYAGWTELTPLALTEQAGGDAVQLFSEYPVTAETVMPWKKVICFGDMITVGVQVGKPRNWGVDTVNYPGVVASYYGPEVTVINAGTLDAAVSRKAAGSFEQIILNNAALHGDADAVFFMAGTTDWVDNRNDSIDAFARDYRSACEVLRDRYPGADVFVILPPDGNYYFEWTLGDMREKEREIARDLGFYVIDLSGWEILDARNDEVRKKYYSTYMHPNNAGYRLMGTVIAAQALELRDRAQGSLIPDADGLRLTTDNEWAHKYTGFFETEGTTYYLVNGRVSESTTGIVSGATGRSDQSLQRMYVRDGTVDTGFTGVADTPSGRYYVENGVVSGNSTGIIKDGDRAWVVRESKCMEPYAGMYADGGRLWYLRDGVADEAETAALNARRVNAVDYGATPGDDTDDTAALNSAANATPDGGVLYIPSGVYMIDPLTGLQIVHRENLTVVMEPDTVLKAMANNAGKYHVVRIRDSENISVIGGQVQGDRKNHSYAEGGTHEGGHGIQVDRSDGVSLTGVTARDCTGDGVYLGIYYWGAPVCDGVTLRGCLLENNRRNNLSIVAADNVCVDSCTIRAANGTAPQWGICIEPNRNGAEFVRPCKNITISNTNIYAFLGRTGDPGYAYTTMGCTTWMTDLDFAAENVVIRGCYFDGDFVNFSVKSMQLHDTVITGTVYVFRKMQTEFYNVRYRNLISYY